MGLEIRPVAGKRELNTFIKLPWRLYRNERNWVPPLFSERRRFLDRRRNPFFAHAGAEYLLAWRDDRPVGRITAHSDRRFNQFQGQEWGMFGFFESEPDQEAVSALLTTAEAWLRARGRDRMVGPMDFTANDECGVLIDGHDLLPTILTGGHHRYYPELIETAGLGKAMDLYMGDLRVRERDRVHPAIWRAAAELESKYGITVRAMRKDGETLGAARTLPDYHEVLIHLGGRLLPFGWAKALWYRRKIDRVRVFVLGVKREWQHTGIAAKFYELHFDAAERTPQKEGETGWILETNKSMNRAMRGMGGTSSAPTGSTRRSFELDRRRCHHARSMSDELDLTHQAGAPGTEEVVDGLPVLADVRAIEPASRIVLPAVQAAAAAATGFVAGAATVALMRRAGARKLSRNQRRVPRRTQDGLPIVASRTFLVDVHLLAKPSE